MSTNPIPYPFLFPNAALSENDPFDGASDGGLMSRAGTSGTGTDSGGRWGVCIGSGEAIGVGK